MAYLFDGDEHPINIIPHGNSRKQCKGYTKKKPSALSEVMLRANQTSILQAVEENIAKHGGRENIPEEYWVNNANIYRRNASTSCGSQLDDFALIMEWSEQNQMCRFIASHPEPVIVLATDQQIKDMERFTCGDKASPISVNATFSLGKFCHQSLTEIHLS